MIKTDVDGLVLVMIMKKKFPIHGKKGLKLSSK